MDEKKSNRLYIIIGVLAVLLLLLMVLIGILLRGGKDEAQPDTRNAGPFVKTGDTDTTEDVFGKELGTEENQPSTEYGKGTTVITDGYKMVVPGDYICTWVEDIGPVIYMDDVFLMKLEVKDGSYEELAKDVGGITEKAIAAGGRILQDVKEVTLDGRKYIYYIVDLMGDKTFVIYTGVSEDHLGSQIVILSDNLTDADFINVFASIAITAQKTEEPDSTLEDIMAQASKAGIGEAKKESSLSFEGEMVTYQVPEQFYSQGFEEGSAYMSEQFLSEDYISVTCLLQKKSEADYNSARDYIDVEFDWMMANVQSESSVQSIALDGNTFYYIDVHYEFDGTDMQKIIAACDYGEAGIYIVKLNALDIETELSLDTIKAFLTIK